jgi:IS5 family transposase
MLRDRYEPMNLFALVPALSFTLEPTLARLDVLLDDDLLFQEVKADLARRFPRTLIDGRPSTPVEVILRLLVIKHLHGWSYAQTERWVNDSLVLRQFCRVYLRSVPDDTTLIRWAGLIQPATLQRLLDHVVGLARSLKVTRGRKLRLDGTVVSDLHPSPDRQHAAPGRGARPEPRAETCQGPAPRGSRPRPRGVPRPQSERQAAGLPDHEDDPATRRAG